MDLSIKGKNAIVCASSQGLGKSAAVDLAKEGVNLAICSRNKDKINLVKQEIEQTSDVKVVAIEADLSSEKDISALFQEAKKELKTIDILINNAGITGPTAKLWDYNIKDWNSIIDINFLIVKQFLKIIWYSCG